MNRTTKTLIGAVAIATLWGGTAFADCPGAGQTFAGGIDSNKEQIHGDHGNHKGLINKGWNVSNFDSDTGDKTDTDCYTARAHGFGHGMAVSGIIVTDPDDTDEGEYVGPDTIAHGPNGTALGNHALVGRWETYKDEEGDEQERLVPISNGTALGANTTVSHDHSTAIGADAASTNDHQVTLGTEEETIRAPGITSQLSKDRQTGPLEIVTSDGQGNLATDGGATHAAIDANSLAIGDNSAAIDANGLRIDENSAGVAMALAMDIPDVDIDRTFGLAASWGNFEGENAFAAAAAWRINPTWSVNAGIGVGVNTHTVGGRAGIRGQW